MELLRIDTEHAITQELRKRCLPCVDDMFGLVKELFAFGTDMHSYAFTFHSLITLILCRGTGALRLLTEIFEKTSLILIL